MKQENGASAGPAPAAEGHEVRDGLDAAPVEGADGASTERVFMVIPLAQIDVKPQVRERFDEVALQALAQTIKNGGLLQPVLVEPNGARFMLNDGERRFRACELAGRESIPALVERAALTDAERLRLQLVANCQRVELTPIEKARGMDRLMREADCSAEDVAEMLGMSPASVSRSLKLLKLPEDVQARIDTGQLAASTAYEIAKADPGVQAELVAAARAGRLKRDVAARRSRANARPTRRRSPRSAPRTERIEIPAGDGRALIVTGGGIELAELITLLEETVARLRTVSGTEPANLAAALAAMSQNNEAE